MATGAVVASTLLSASSLTAMMILIAAVHDCTASVCSSNPCQHDGRCIEYTQGGGYYGCDCKGGYYGVRCEDYSATLDPCKLSDNTSPCTYRGKCVAQFGNNFTCTCYLFWTGINCRIYNGTPGCDPDNLPPASLRCSGHGQCLDYLGCNCDVGYHGNLCQFRDHNSTTAQQEHATLTPAASAPLSTKTVFIVVGVLVGWLLFIAVPIFIGLLNRRRQSRRQASQSVAAERSGRNTLSVTMATSGRLPTVASLPNRTDPPSYTASVTAATGAASVVMSKSSLADVRPVSLTMPCTDLPTDDDSPMMDTGTADTQPLLTAEC
eukprot:scpid59118/ scgid19001/ Protocadherin Fat 1; Cadherin family member 7; Cadherin-related tumor suppressor homolog; Protein fat homolog; Protocadherin Fat 1, nuclear form